jgi:hypothetical protein
MMGASVFLVLALIGSTLLVSSCKIGAPVSPSASASAPSVTDEERQAIYARSIAELDNVVLFKPRTDETHREAIYMAPLLLLDKPRTGPEIRSRSVKKVWFHRSQTTINGRSHEQQGFYWSMAGREFFQGVRVTLDSSAVPIFWEILQDSSDAELIWVSQATEIKAADQFGTALPGRLCSVERGFSETPLVVVPNVVDDGPLPMGPVIYLFQNGDVPMVACRCSSTHARTLEAQSSYELEEVDFAQLRRILQSSRRLAASETNWFDPMRLEKRLRIPD